MTLVLVNYANFRYKKTQRHNNITGLQVGGFDKVFSYSKRNIDKNFYRKNRHILRQERGDGYWLWKPYFIKKTLEKVNYGDFVFYCDSGAYFIDSIRPLLKLSDEFDLDIISFELEHIEKQWTKRDTFLLMNCDTPIYYESLQRLACFSLWRKSEFTEKFIDEYIAHAKDQRILTDLENQLGLANYDGFQEHRHDQSIFSLLLKKYDIIPFRDPSQWGNNIISLYPNSPYGQLINHTRSTYRTPLQILKDFIKNNILKIKQMNKILGARFMNSDT